MFCGDSHPTAGPVIFGDCPTHTWGDIERKTVVYCEMLPASRHLLTETAGQLLMKPAAPGWGLYWGEEVTGGCEGVNCVFAPPCVSG